MTKTKKMRRNSETGEILCNDGNNLLWIVLYWVQPVKVVEMIKLHMIIKPLYQARESSLVPLRLLTVNFVKKT